MPLLILFLVLLVLAIIIMPFMAMAKASRAEWQAKDLARRVNTLERQIEQLKRAPQVTETSSLMQQAKLPAEPAMPPPPWIKPEPPKPAPLAATPPPSVVVSEKTVPAADIRSPAPAHKEGTPPPPPVSLPAKPAAPQKPVPSQINWEQFMGAKLFAWIGGLALFLGVAFFIKYSFEHNLISPEMRVAVGFLAGAALLVGGVMMKRKETAVTAQTLCSTGILILYGVTFACHSLYHFAFFGQGATFAIMTAITVVAFGLSVKMDAMVIAVLGIAGGFLTPGLLSTGHDAPLALFGYIALLDAGLLAVALRQRWNALPILGAIGTVIMETGWLAKFFVPEQYFLGHKVLIAMAVFAGFEMLFLAAVAVASRVKRASRNLTGSALAMGVVALMTSFFFLDFTQLGNQPGLLFSYVLVVDLALIAIVFLDKSIPHAEALAGPLIFLILMRWTDTYVEQHHLLAALGFYLLFSVLHLAVPALLGYLRRATLPWWSNSLLMLALPFYFITFDVMRQHPALLFGTVFLASLALLGFAFLNKESATTLGVAGITTFLLLTIWTCNSVTNDLLYVALGLYFIFALLHSLAPIALHKIRGFTLPWWSNAFPALALILVLIPIFMLPELSILVWPLVLLIDILAVLLAVITAAVLPIVVVLLLTLVATGMWIFRIPANLTGLPTSLVVLGGFAIFFIVAATFVSRWLLKSATAKAGAEGIPSIFGDASNPANLTVQIPALATVLPFLLLIMLTLRLPLANASPIFGLALMLVVLLLGLAKIMSLEALPAVGLGSVLALEYAWHLNHFHPESPAMPLLLWYLAFYLVFTVFPFLFHKQFEKSAVPWGAAALAGPLHFYLVHNIVRTCWPGLHGVMGLLPAAFSIPAILGVIALLKRTPADSPARNAQLAWFGGVALLFITLIFPIQFHRQWITIGWALEGAALCWLFHRIPHRGLSLTGTALLVVAFCRLALNPAVLSYHERAGMPVLNWYLYAYGVAIVCLFAGARLLAPPRNLVLGSNVPPVLYTLGAILGFLLVNIEIADFFTLPGAQTLTFEFSGHFGRDMSYSIAWALFALLMLVIGITKKIAPVRYASIGLLAVTLLKLFFHDLSQLDQLYRIAAFIVVAIIAIFASFLYQRFLGTVEKKDEAP